MTYRALLFDGGLAFASWAAAGSLRPFMRRLLITRQCYPADLVGVCWDAPRDSTWRRQRSPAYKAKRPPSPDGLSDALRALMIDLPALDIVQYSAPAHEADDVLYSLSRTLPGPVLLCSGDKDMLQAVRPGVELLRTGSAAAWSRPDQIITAADIWGLELLMGKARVCGLTARGWGDLLTLAGDTTDGIPGLRGVGPKHAMDLLVSCPDFVSLVLDDGPEGQDQARRECAARSATAAKLVEKAIAHVDELRLSRELVRLRLVEVEAVDAAPDPDRAQAILEGAHLEGCIA